MYSGQQRRCLSFVSSVFKQITTSRELITSKETIRMLTGIISEATEFKASGTPSTLWLQEVARLPRAYLYVIATKKTVRRRGPPLLTSFAITTSRGSLNEGSAPLHAPLASCAGTPSPNSPSNLYGRNAGKWQYDRSVPPCRVCSRAYRRTMQGHLAGFFWASLGSMDAQRTTSPTRALPPHGSLPILPHHSYALRHAHLPSENVHTENLTPFLRLLPCPASAGIATLLNPHKLFDADWHGLGRPPEAPANPARKISYLRAIWGTFPPANSHI
ncbi:Gpi16-domain-containing protein [Peniophora sp. CONT]|nr:Gpi16-domain-containing protein [Peniophora sp. CONT]